MNPIRFERRTEELLSFPCFMRRLAMSFLLAMSVMAIALMIGVLGYHSLAKLRWIDSLLNAAMILTGMGPVDPMRTTAAKLFASAYALFSGVVFLSSVGVLISPVFHRFLHHFHLDEVSQEKDEEKEGVPAPPKPGSRRRT